jgi:maltose O-acetyltransferase
VNSLWKAFFAARRCYVRQQWKWNRWRFLLFEKPQHARVEIGEEVFFKVPVRGGGQGTIRIGSRNNFGAQYVHRLGTGEIMICAVNPASEIVIGDGNFLDNNMVIAAAEKVTIGNDCLLGDLVSITDCDFHEVNPATRRQSQGAKAPVTIGNNVWLGSGTAVLKGVTIGDNSIVGARSVVTKSIPANCIAVGNPARVVRSLS